MYNVNINGQITIGEWLATNISTAKGGTGISSTAVFPVSGNVAVISDITNAINNVSGLLIGTQYLTSGTTYTPTSGTKKIIAYLVGGGGAGGGTTAASANAAGAGGGAGGFICTGLITLPIAPNFTYAIGAAGTGVNGNNGNGGTITSLIIDSITYNANGGSGGSVSTGIPQAGALGGSLSVVGGSALYAERGQNGGNSFVITSGTTHIISGIGGESPFGQAGSAVFNTSAPGNAAVGNGCGGSGAASAGTAALRTGGNGSGGAILIFEYT